MLQKVNLYFKRSEHIFPTKSLESTNYTRKAEILLKVLAVNGQGSLGQLWTLRRVKSTHVLGTDSSMADVAHWGISYDLKSVFYYRKFILVTKYFSPNREYSWPVVTNYETNSVDFKLVTIYFTSVMEQSTYWTGRVNTLDIHFVSFSS